MAGAIPAETHIAFGSMYHRGVHLCGQPVCPPYEEVFLSIEASTSPERHGTALYGYPASVTIMLNCVVVETYSLNHLLYASGKGPGGRMYYITVWDPAVGLSKFDVVNYADDYQYRHLEPRCDVTPVFSVSELRGTAGDFEIQP